MTHADRDGMELTSEPAVVEETVRDYEFAFSGGDPVQVTLREGDTITNNVDAITITYAPLPGRVAGVLDLFKRNLLWVSERTRVIVKPAPKADALSHGQ